MPPSESPANRKTKSRLRLEIVEPARVVQNVVELRLNLQRKNRRIDAIEGIFQEIDITGIEERRWGNDLFVEAVDFVGEIDTERGMADGQLHAKPNAG